MPTGFVIHRDHGIKLSQCQDILVVNKIHTIAAAWWKFHFKLHLDDHCCTRIQWGRQVNLQDTPGILQPGFSGGIIHRHPGYFHACTIEVWQKTEINGIQGYGILVGVADLHLSGQACQVIPNIQMDMVDGCPRQLICQGWICQSG